MTTMEVTTGGRFEGEKGRKTAIDLVKKSVQVASDDKLYTRRAAEAAIIDDRISSASFRASITIATVGRPPL